MYDYGNARIAALRSRLLEPTTLRRLADADSPGAFLALLEREEDWRPIIGETAPLTGDPLAALEASIERHRSVRLGSLPPLYPAPARSLVETLVLPLDHARILAIVRRRSAGEPPDSIAPTILGGALLDAATLGALSRTPSLDALIRGLAHSRLLRPEDAKALSAEIGRGIGRRGLEERLAVALDGARGDGAAGWGADAAAVREILERERVDRAAIADELLIAGPSAAALVERTITLARLDGLARIARRDPLGIGPVAGYVAAIEAQAIRLRASLARVVAGWGHDLVGLYLSPTGG